MKSMKISLRALLLGHTDLSYVNPFDIRVEASVNRNETPRFVD